MEKIIEPFLYNKKLKFNEIEKILKIRSNKLSYHLKQLEKKGILIKEKEFYKLSETAETLIPYIHSKKAVLPVVLISIEKNKKIFLHKRNKRPYKDFLSLPAGRIYLGETIQTATKRIMKEKFNLNVKFKKINSISLEKVKKKNKAIHSFLLILITATTKNKVKFIDIDKNKLKIIPSDYKLMKNDLKKEINIKTIVTKI